MSEERVSRQRRRARARKQAKRAALTLGAALAAVPAAQAATFTVSNLDDSGPGSLRQAIEDANAVAGPDVVDFQAGVTGTILLTTGQLEIRDSVDIQGPGPAALAVSGGNSSRVFYLYNGSALLGVTISGLTITGGNASNGGGIADWGESLVLDNVLVTGNTASGGDGGGLWASDYDNSGMTLAIRNSVFSGNSASDDGGGIHFYLVGSDTRIEDSTISGNSAAGAGGGIYVDDTNGGTHLIRRTTISGNDAGEGGGVHLARIDDPFVIENSTISGNQATEADGGGVQVLYNLYLGFRVRHSTIAGNTAAGQGGGVFAATSVPLEHTIVGDNAAAGNPDLGGGPGHAFDLGFSLIENPGTANVVDNGGNVFNQDPQLGPLQNTGGPTQTHRPASTSPAVNAGDPAFSPPPETDQRGFARQIGIVDIGAVELAPGTIQLTFSAASIAETGGFVTITATRTGGSDGAVSVTLDTADGTAAAPVDYGAVIASLLNWGDGDMAPRSVDVTIVNDAAQEGNETFTATISGPTGGAILGSPTTAVITIEDDEAPAVVAEIPTVGDVGRVLLTALMTASGLYLLRRKRPT